MAAQLSQMDDNGDPGRKRLSVERIYQKLSQLEHVLVRPDTYIGSVEESTQPMWVYDKEKGAIVSRQLTFVPGLYKIYDEILVNAADNKQRDPKMNSIKITIDPENNTISVWNNGAGIPVEMHSVEKLYVPELIFGTLLTSSNYNDDQKKVTGGRNGYGAKLCNIFSSEFTIETSSSESGKMFKQTWKNNMNVSGKNTITTSKKDYTKVTFKPDLARFNMTHLDDDIVALMTRRAYDIAGCTKGVAVYLNGEKLPIKSFKEYVELYLKGQPDEETDFPRKVVHEIVNPRWEVCVTASSHGFQQSSFVNSIATTKGGTHVTLVVDQVVSKVLEVAKKKNKGGMDLKPFHIRGHLWVFVNCLIENPTFDSQTKETMTLKAKSFGSQCPLGEKFIKQVLSCGVVDRVLSWAKVKSQTQLNKAQHGTKSSKLRGIPKLDDANNAGTKNSQECTLIVTEGDSAKSLAVSGLGVVGRDNFGVFPLRGKLLNVREATHTQVMNNEEIKNVIKILGLQYGKKYNDAGDLKGLRYGNIMIMADQDQDGSHIKGLVINFFHYNWPHLLRHGFLQEFITPIVKVTKGKEEIPFFSLPEFEHWKAVTDNAHTWKVKYYKGLGTSTSKEAKEYFSDMDLHRIPFAYKGTDDDQAIELAFSKKCVNDRKTWLMSWLKERKEKRAIGLQESYLYGERTDSITYSDFINKELILFSNMDNERSIPSLVDGFKPGQRKVIYTCFKRNDKKDIKVAQLAGSVAEQSAYHHGEASLMATIINLAQNFVGSNNVNVLQPIGQFGTRLHGGKDAASPRYIFTQLSPLARMLFPSADDPILNYLYDDNLRIEPEWYCPILPMVLVNGAEGIGTGYATNIPNFDPREIVTNLKRLMNEEEPVGMKPHYKNFQGIVAPIEPQKYAVYGRVGLLSETSFEITELPIKTWTQNYKENVLELMLHGTEKSPPFITDYKEYHTDTTVKFVVNLTAAKMEEAKSVGIYKKFKLESTVNTSNMVLFDSDGCLKKYENELDILREFYDTRLSMYRKRKEYMEGQLAAESLRLYNQARFIMEKIEGKLILENKTKNVLIKELSANGYDSDPVKAWKKSVATAEDDEEESTEGPDYSYLWKMQLIDLTKEKKEELLKKRDNKAKELEILKNKTIKDIWFEDLNDFMTALDELEEHEKQQESASAMITSKKKNKGKGRQAKLTAAGTISKGKGTDITKPSPFAEAIEPIIPEYCAEKKEPKTKKPKAPKVDPNQTKLKFHKTKAGTVDDDDNDDGSVVITDVDPLVDASPIPKVKRTKRTISKTVTISDDSNDDDDDDFMEKPKKKMKKTLITNEEPEEPVTITATTSSGDKLKPLAATKKALTVAINDDDAEKKKKKAGNAGHVQSKLTFSSSAEENKKKRQRKTSLDFSDEDTSDDEKLEPSKKSKKQEPRPLKKPPPVKTKTKTADVPKKMTVKADVLLDDGSEEDSFVKPVRSRREHKKVKYFDDDDDMDDDSKEKDEQDDWNDIDDYSEAESVD